MRTAFFARKCSVIELLVDDGLFGFFVKDMDTVGIKCNFDFATHLRLTACIHIPPLLPVRLQGRLLPRGCFPDGYRRWLPDRLLHLLPPVSWTCLPEGQFYGKWMGKGFDWQKQSASHQCYHSLYRRYLYAAHRTANYTADTLSSADLLQIIPFNKEYRMQKTAEMHFSGLLHST